MRTELSGEGRLIALEGARGPDVTAAAQRLLRQCAGPEGAGGISVWDASNIFYELRWGNLGVLKPSPRTLVLLYAADLAFRLRWEIRPALEKGGSVVAAPYVESALAFGRAAGLPRRWLAELFRFAPRAQACYRLEERCGKEPCTCKLSDGYLEFCCAALRNAYPAWDPTGLRREFIGYFEALERRGGCRSVTEPLDGAPVEADPDSVRRVSVLTG